MKKTAKLLVLTTLTLSAFAVTSLSAKAAQQSSSQTNALGSVTLFVTNHQIYQTPKLVHSNKSHFVLYNAHLFDHSKKVTFTPISFTNNVTKTHTTYKITKKIDTKNVHWLYVQKHGWIMDDSTLIPGKAAHK